MKAASDLLDAKVNVAVELFDADGNLKQRELVHNLVTTAGKEAIAKLLKEGVVRPSHMAVGKGNEEAKVGDTKLKEELDRNAAALGVAGAVLTVTGEWAAGDGTGAIVEAGIFSAAAEGTMFTRAVFGVVNKGAEDTLKITWTITVG